MNQHTFDDLLSLLKRSWCRETSATPDEWSDENPSRGQCAVTALVVQDIIGGHLARTTVRGESHYLNRSVDGMDDFDFTFDQFGEPDATPYALYDHIPLHKAREYVLSFPDTAFRYQLLRARMFRRMSEDLA